MGLCVPRLEQHVFPDDPGRRCDIVLDGINSNGHPVVIDVVTISPYVRLGASAAEPGGAAAAVEARKRAEYASLPADRFTFAPIGYDMLGAPGPSARLMLKRLSARIADRHGQPRPTLLLYHRVELQAFVQRKIAQLLLVNTDGDGSGRGLVQGDTQRQPTRQSQPQEFQLRSPFASQPIESSE
jgi:hypothetical protein